MLRSLRLVARLWISKGSVKLEGQRSANNCYMWTPGTTCLSASVENDCKIWHQKLGHLNFRTLIKLANHEIVRGLPKLSHDSSFVCGPCNKGKQVKVNHKVVPDIGTTHALELIHMDLMGPINVQSRAGKKYIFVMVDDFTRYTWVRFLREKSDAFESFRVLALQLRNGHAGVETIRSDHGGEFQNEFFDKFCNDQGIVHQYSAPRTPQQNGLVERKNRTLQEMARAMLHGNDVPQHLWDEAVNTACYIINRVYVRQGTTKTPYELLKGKTPTVTYFHVFGCTCYILNDKDHLGKFDAKSDEGIFLGYSERSKAYRVFIKRTKLIQEVINVSFDDIYVPILPVIQPTNNSVSADRESESSTQKSDKENSHPEQMAEQEADTSESDDSTAVPRNHSKKDVIGEIQGDELQET